TRQPVWPGDVLFRRHAPERAELRRRPGRQLVRHRGRQPVLHELGHQARPDQPVGPGWDRLEGISVGAALTRLPGDLLPGQGATAAPTSTLSTSLNTTASRTSSLLAIRLIGLARYPSSSCPKTSHQATCLRSTT